MHRFTSKAENALRIAAATATEFGHARVGTEHLLYGLTAEEQGIASRLLEGAGINTEKPLCLAYSGLSDEAVRNFAQSTPLLANTQIASVGATIGTHVGPNVIAVAFFNK